MAKRYYLDEDLLYKRIRLTNKQKFIRFILYFVASLILAYGYNIALQKINGSPKEKILNEQLEEIKLQYVTLDKDFKRTYNYLHYFHEKDNMYREIFDVDTFEFNFASGGIDFTKNSDISNNSSLIVDAKQNLAQIQYMINRQNESSTEITKYTTEWIRELEHLPLISPVNTNIRRGDGVKFREIHPVLGRPAWHHGQDFSAPMNTPIHATGAGRIIYLGYDKGLGNFIRIDHGYGFQTIYGHLSRFNTNSGQNVKRGDVIGFSGSTGYSTGPHLHYEIHLYGKYQNPLYFFGDDLTEDEYLDMIDTLNQLFKK